MQRSSERPENSGTIGWQPLASVAGRSIGQQRGETGFDERGSRSLDPVGRREVVVFETEAEVVQSLKLSDVRWLGTRRTADLAGIDSPFGADLIVVGYDVPNAVPVSAAPELVGARRKLIELCRPLSGEDLVRELTRARILMSRTARSDEDWDLIVEAYADELRAYPADIVIDALRYVVRAEKWWPSWAELLEIVEHRARPRRALLAALNELVRLTYRGPVTV